MDRRSGGDQSRTRSAAFRGQVQTLEEAAHPLIAPVRIEEGIHAQTDS
jgi:hypothetical protein